MIWPVTVLIMTAMFCIYLALLIWDAVTAHQEAWFVLLLIGFAFEVILIIERGATVAALLIP